MFRSAVLAAALLVASSAASQAADPASCKVVRIGSGGWTDNIVQDALAMNVLEGMGYAPKELELSLEILVESLKNDDLDVHFDYWSPSSDSLMKPHIESGAIENLGANITDLRYTLAVPAKTWEAGLKDFADIAKFKDQLDGKIYGQSPGSDSNTLILNMIEKNAFGLAGFELVESSEQGMLSQVERSIRQDKPIVFVGWAPHPMNTKYDMKYLSGGDEYFGPDYGAATVYTIATRGLTERCPNLGAFLRNVKFTVDMENELMLEVLDQNANPLEAAKAWLSAHPDVVEAWLQGVTTLDGAPALAPVKAHLGG